jgi:hypothetical protein
MYGFKPCGGSQAEIAKMATTGIEATALREPVEPKNGTVIPSPYQHLKEVEN